MIKNNNIGKAYQLKEKVEKGTATNSEKEEYLLFLEEFNTVYKKQIERYNSKKKFNELTLIAIIFIIIIAFIYLFKNIT